MRPPDVDREEKKLPDDRGGHRKLQREEENEPDIRRDHADEKPHNDRSEDYWNVEPRRSGIWGHCRSLRAAETLVTFIPQVSWFATAYAGMGRMLPLRQRQ
ncbi:hypothetical protein GCM10022276_00120 [Sphingomonas limnosediminicola]|uniref:Uncharacterized protein n=1 Tax=Sphingomonas limnosediminicola TaxID=940133 RepID=A0ABP7KSR3_9SPHN